ncbi:hypothetical protein QBC36DRAFT_294519 [Triangularia setosa]|uniref:Uncharacterized protein n=1 Tax=Triangularia setosa TaxID=2587417 RepID=A0AAN6W129_9PEZI|nr:hypothetical protein QBC36DRAFT_294519 [Podospora setosa]
MPRSVSLAIHLIYIVTKHTRCNCVPLQTSPKVIRITTLRQRSGPTRSTFSTPAILGAQQCFSLPALDVGGIDFDTALAACGLIAGNRWSDGFFSLDRGGAVSVERPDNGILREPQYFFHLPGPLDPPYPIVPRFSHWRFPHNHLPSLWQKWAADTSATRMAGDVARRCVLSNYGDGLEMARLLPAGEDDMELRAC